jgi:uncharacterized caspase-like protein
MQLMRWDAPLLPKQILRNPGTPRALYLKSASHQKAALKRSADLTGMQIALKQSGMIEASCVIRLIWPYCWHFPFRCRSVRFQCNGSEMVDIWVRSAMALRIFGFVFALLALFVPGVAAAQNAPLAEKRIALVIGNANYQAGPLKTAANDAGLIAQTLQAAGFDVVGARDLDQDSMRRAFRDFIDKARAAGPNTVAVVYLSGYGLQLEGENYFVPIEGRIERDSDVTTETVRVSDYTRSLAALNLKARIIVLDAARANPFATSGAPLAGGLALVEPEAGTLIAFNAAPGTVVREGRDDYGAYASALAEMMREGGLPLNELFGRVRLRVNDETKGAEVPWHSSKVDAPFVFFERGPDAPPPAVSIEQTQSIRARPIRDFDAREAYIAALERDTLQGYFEFLSIYPDDPMAKRVRAIVAARREAITWRRTRSADTPDSYWSYLRRYPTGPHASDARRRLAFLAATFEPPRSFAMLDYDVPPPPPEEFTYIERPVFYFDDPIYGFAPPPPPPPYYLAPISPDYVLLPPPLPPLALFFLPIPIYRPVPLWVRTPDYVVPPRNNNVIFNNIHNTVVINNTTNIVTITNPSGQATTLSPAAQTAVSPAARTGAPGARRPPATAGTAAALIGPALPPSVAQKASTIPNQPAPQRPVGAPVAPGLIPSQQLPPQTRQPPQQPPLGQPLPGTQRQTLPPGTHTPSTGAARSGPSQQQTPNQLPTTAPTRPSGAPPAPATQAPSTSPTPPVTSVPSVRVPAPPKTTRVPPPTGPRVPAAPSTNNPPSGARLPSTLTPSQTLSPSTATRQSPPPPLVNRPSPPPPAVNRPSPPSPTVNRQSPPPPVVNRTPPSAPTINRPAQQPPVVNRMPSPPAAISRPSSPPPVINRAAPPAAITRAPAPPPAVSRPPPPAPVANKPPPPPAPVVSRPPPSCPAGTRLLNGQCVK